jgi:glycosyltransferase involved in cell wall biosynthesis
MKYPCTGLFSYCAQLGMQLGKAIDTDDEELTYYTPLEVAGVFGNDHNYITQNSLQKFFLPSLSSYNVWHATYQGSQYLPKLNKRIKVVLTIHDLNFLYDQKKPQFKKLKHLRHLQNNIDRSDAIICISEFCKTDVLTHCKVGTKPIHVIHNGTNSLVKPFLSGSSYKPRTRFLFSIGVINRKKNFHVLLPLLQHNQDMELLIAGVPDDPDYMHYIRDRAKKLGVEEQVQMLGAISEGEKSWYYQNCYAFTFPSLAEGFGLPVAEAMSVGKPLFLSDKSALPEIGKDVAFYFPSFNGYQMQQVFTKGMEQYKSSSSLKEKIKKRSTEFCWRKAAAQYLDVYRSL